MNEKGEQEPALKGVYGKGCLHSWQMVVLVKKNHPRVAQVVSLLHIAIEGDGRRGIAIWK
jgi:hypothetical protein